MAKAAAAKTGKKTAPKAPVKKAGTSPEVLIVSVCEAALSKLSELNLDQQLQSEINWCLGSYSHDRNPVGLYAMAERALHIFKEGKAAKIKGITPKIISDLEKALAAR